MTKSKYFMRYGIIVNYLRRNKSAGYEEIRNYLKEQSNIIGYDMNVSKRTFDRDREEIADLFHVYIEYDFSQRVYRIHDEDYENINDRMLEAFDMFNSLNMSHENQPYVIFEKRRPQGTEHFYGMLHAIKNCFLVKFTYTKFWDDTSEDRLAEPYALKESKSRWYLLAKDLKDNNVKSFGLDRIHCLEIQKRKFTYPAGYNPNDEYFYSFGILTEPGNKPENVVLSFSEFQGKYIKSFPLHHSQQIVTDNNRELRIRLILHLTKDFIMEILSFGDEVKVVSPEKLKKMVVGIMKGALEGY